MPFKGLNCCSLRLHRLVTLLLVAIYKFLHTCLTGQNCNEDEYVVRCRCSEAASRPRTEHQPKPATRSRSSVSSPNYDSGFDMSESSYRVSPTSKSSSTRGNYLSLSLSVSHLSASCYASHRKSEGLKVLKSVEEIHSVDKINNVETSYFTQLKMCYLMTTFRCPSHILITS